MRLRKAAPWVLGGLSVLILTVHALAVSWQPQVDFQVYRMGGQHVLGTGLYQSYVTAGSRKLLFTYTPAAAILFWPISHLSIRAGQLVWDLANIVALAALIAVSSAAVRQRRLARWDWQLALMALAPVGLLWWPVRYGFDLGQVNVLLTLMVLFDLTMTASWRGRSLPRGVLVGVAAAIKLTPLIFVPFLLLTRQWRAARNAVVSFLAFTLAMVALAPRSSWSYFTKYVDDVNRIGSSAITDNQTLRAALLRTGLHPSHVVVDALLLVFCGAGLALAAVAFRSSSKVLGILVCSATGLMASPISWQHHYVWSVPLVFWLVFGVDRPKWGAVWAAVVAVVFLVMPPTGPPAHLTPISYLWANAYTVATVAFMALVTVMLWSRRRSSSGRTQPARAPGDTATLLPAGAESHPKTPRPLAKASISR